MRELEGGSGFYVVSVAADAQKPGCGTEGAPITFTLLADAIDEGTPAAQSEAWRAGAVEQLDLSAVPQAVFGAFVGELPAVPGLGVMRWSGASATPVARAVATIAREVESVNYYDVAAQTFRTYVPAAPAYVSDYLLVDRGDIVFVRVR